MQITLQINGQTVNIRKGATIMKTAAQAGIHIPHFCYHDKLSIAASCRMCLVDVEKSPKPLPACATAALDGMVVRTDSLKTKEAQNSVMEFLLINHPLDCPICDQGGECQLQDLAVGYGMSRSRYAEEKRVSIEKNLGPLIATDMTRCIHCTRCVRFGREIGGIMEMGMTGRGEHAEIMPFVERTIDSELSGNMIDVCPVGALTSKPFRYTARPWELKHHSGIAAHDSWGSRLSLHTKNGAVKRVKPKESEDINQCWLSDRDRFSYLGLAGERCHTPLLRTASARGFEELIWTTAKNIFAQRLRSTVKNHGADSVGFFASPHTTQEELFLLQKLARGTGCENIDCRLRQRDFSAADISDYGFQIKDIGYAGGVLFVGAEPARELPLLPVRFRQVAGKRRRLMAIGALDIGAQVPLTAQHLTRPSAIAEQLWQINRFLKLTTAKDDSLLFDCPNSLRDIAKQLQSAQEPKHILLGDAALGTANAGDIVRQARILAEGIGAKVGALSAGANGAGAAQASFRPEKNGRHTASMLRRRLQTVVLYNCEAEDFTEQSLAHDMLANADFVIALSTHTDRLNKYANMMLPIAAFAENEGTLINGENRTQFFTAAAKAPGQAHPGWKILRLLGEALGVSGFDFSTLEDVRQLLSAANAADTTKNAASSDTVGTAPSMVNNDGFELVGGVCLYDTDMIVRRTAVLQQTAVARAAAGAYFHPDDMQTQKLVEGTAVRLVDDEGGAWETVARADKRVARGAVLAYPTTLRATRNIRVEIVSAT